jgi:hypothetical protein
MCCQTSVRVQAERSAFLLNNITIYGGVRVHALTFE